MQNRKPTPNTFRKIRPEQRSMNLYVSKSGQLRVSRIARLRAEFFTAICFARLLLRAVRMVVTPKLIAEAAGFAFAAFVLLVAYVLILATCLP